MKNLDAVYDEACKVALDTTSVLFKGVERLNIKPDTASVFCACVISVMRSYAKANPGEAPAVLRLLRGKTFPDVWVRDLHDRLAHVDHINCTEPELAEMAF